MPHRQLRGHGRQEELRRRAAAWNKLGLGVQVEVRGKEKPPEGDASRPRLDGVTLWLDMRDARASHRASRYCHQFHLLASGGGPERDEPAVAEQDQPRWKTRRWPRRTWSCCVFTQVGGYTLEAFLPAAAMHGYDPERYSRLGFFYAVRDEELGEQSLSVGPEFPFWEDPSLWSVLELTRELITSHGGAAATMKSEIRMSQTGNFTKALFVFRTSGLFRTSDFVLRISSPADRIREMIGAVSRWRNRRL